jgi:hypothetical protein
VDACVQCKAVLDALILLKHHFTVVLRLRVIDEYLTWQICNDCHNKLIPRMGEPHEKYCTHCGCDVDFNINAQNAAVNVSVLVGQFQTPFQIWLPLGNLPFGTPCGKPTEPQARGLISHQSNLGIVSILGAVCDMDPAVAARKAAEAAEADRLHAIEVTRRDREYRADHRLPSLDAIPEEVEAARAEVESLPPGRLCDTLTHLKRGTVMEVELLVRREKRTGAAGSSLSLLCFLRST